MNVHHCELPLTKELIKNFKAGDLVYLSGTVLTARDAAHKRLNEEIINSTCTLNLSNQTIYYVGPTETPDNNPIGSAGPTTSTRMDKLSPLLFENGLVATIGKGDRSQEFIDLCVKHSVVYLVATGGVGALLATKIKELEVIKYKDLGTESIKRLKLESFPVFVGYDINGNSLFSRDI